MALRRSANRLVVRFGRETGAERELLDMDAGLLEIEDTRVVVDGKAIRCGPV